MIDTHSHIYCEEFDADRAELAAAEPSFCHPMVGLHPTSVNDNAAWRDEIDMVERLLSAPPMRLYGVGEIGLDLYWSQDFYRQQRDTLHAQLELALQYNLPVAIHTRSAYTEMLDALTTYRGRGLRGVMHAFADSADTARKIAKLGDFVFGVGGVVTFKNSGLDKVVAELPTELLVLETDSPYLAPVPHRGKRNEPAYVGLVCRKIAELHGKSFEEVELVTSATASRIFAL